MIAFFFDDSDEQDDADQRHDRQFDGRWQAAMNGRRRKGPPTGGSAKAGLGESSEPISLLR